MRDVGDLQRNLTDGCDQRAALGHMAKQFAYALYVRTSNHSNELATLVPPDEFIAFCLRRRIYENTSLWTQRSFIGMTGTAMRHVYETVKAFLDERGRPYLDAELDLVMELAAALTALSRSPETLAPRSVLIPALTADGIRYWGVTYNVEADEVEYWDVGDDPSEFRDVEARLGIDTKKTAEGP